MKRLFYSFMVAIVMNCLVFTPIFATLLEQEALAKKVLITSLVELSKDKLHDNIDPIKEHKYTKASKEAEKSGEKHISSPAHLLHHCICSRIPLR